MHSERKRALTIFLLSCVPMSIELVHSVGMLTIVDWKIVCLTFLYWRLSENANKYQSSPVTFTVLQEATKASLCAVVLYAWLSFLTSIRSVAVGCLLGDVTGQTYQHAIFTVCKGGISEVCLNAIDEANRSAWTTRQCPSSLIGSQLAYVYFFLVMVFRFTPSAIYGLWNLSTWRSSRLMDGSSSVLPKKQKVVNNNLLLGTICILLSCMAVEIAMQGRLHPLSSPYVILPFFAVLSFQYTLISQRFRDSSKEALIFLQRQFITMSCIISLLDLLIQILFVVSICVPDFVSISELTETCTTAMGQHHLSKCHEMIRGRTVRPVTSDMCPSMNDNNTSAIGILYAANIIKVLVLSLGAFVL